MGLAVYTLRRCLITAVFSMLGLPTLYSARHRVAEGSKALKIAAVIGTLERDLVGSKMMTL